MPDERVHQLGINAERAGCNKRHQVHQWLTPLTTMCKRRLAGAAVLGSPGKLKPEREANARTADIQRQGLP
jgi:hypothetical protein